MKFIYDCYVNLFIFINILYLGLKIFLGIKLSKEVKLFLCVEDIIYKEVRNLIFFFWRLGYKLVYKKSVDSLKVFNLDICIIFRILMNLR